MPSEKFTHRAVAHTSIDMVWKALDRPETWESIGGIDRVVDPVIDQEGRLVGFSFDSNVAGQTYRGVAKPGGREESRLMAWQIENSEVTGKIEVELAPSGDDTEIAVTLDVASKGMLSSMFFPVIAAATGNGLPRSVDDFAASFG